MSDLRENEVIVEQQPVDGRSKPKTNVPLIFGILSIVFSALNWVGIPIMHLLGIGFGIATIIQAKKGDARDSKVSLILGILGLILGVAALIFGIITGILNALN